MPKTKKATAPVEALHEPAGMPGNLQDVRDLQQMLAQTQAELAAERAQNADLQQQLKDAKWQAASINEALKQTKADIETAKARRGHDPVNERALIAARRALEAGRLADCRFEIERVLSDMNNSWRIAA